LYFSNEVNKLHPICTQECAPKIFPKSIAIYPIPFAQKLWACILHGWGKWQLLHTTLLIGSKSFYLGALKTFEYFGEGPIKVTHYKEKTLSFGMCPKLIDMYCKYV